METKAQRVIRLASELEAFIEDELEPGEFDEIDSREVVKLNRELNAFLNWFGVK